MPKPGESTTQRAIWRSGTSKKSDPVMAEIIERVGPCRMQFGEPTFHALAEAILYQQLNGKAAVTIFDRFTALAGDPLTPQGILKLTDSEMRGVGLSRQKTAYLRDLAREDQGRPRGVRAHGGTF